MTRSGVTTVFVAAVTLTASAAFPQTRPEEIEQQKDDDADSWTLVGLDRT
ncbi:MAG TPA: hypothetical protein VGF24_11150 [Vicinamibacterales bacterium]|jgi:hypothetical protein